MLFWDKWVLGGPRQSNLPTLFWKICTKIWIEAEFYQTCYREEVQHVDFAEPEGIP